MEESFRIPSEQEQESETIQSSPSPYGNYAAFVETVRSCQQPNSEAFVASDGSGYLPGRKEKVEAAQKSICDAVEDGNIEILCNLCVLWFKNSTIWNYNWGKNDSLAIALRKEKDCILSIATEDQVTDDRQTKFFAIVTMILLAGCNSNTHGPQNASIFEECSIRCIPLLLSFGADINQVDKMNGQSAIFHKSGAELKALISAGADVHIKDKLGGCTRYQWEFSSLNKRHRVMARLSAEDILTFENAGCVQQTASEGFCTNCSVC